MSGEEWRPPSDEIAGGARLRVAVPEDHREVAALSRLPCNACADGIDLLSVEQARQLLDGLGMGLWANPMVVQERDGAVGGFFCLTHVDPRHLTARLVTLMCDPHLSGDALGRYAEMMFWAYPLRRLEVRMLGDDLAYRTALSRARFEAEGTLRAALVRGDRTLDVHYLALLRDGVA